MAGFGLGDACGHFEVPVEKIKSNGKGPHLGDTGRPLEFVYCFYYSELE